MINHKCEDNMEGFEIFNHGDEDPEEYGWWMTTDDGYQYARAINYCPFCGMDLMKVEWADLK